MVVGLESLAFLSVQRLGRGGAPGLWKKHWTCFEIQLTTCVSRDTSLHFSGPQCFSFIKLEGRGWIREILRSPPALLGF